MNAGGGQEDPRLRYPLSKDKGLDPESGLLRAEMGCAVNAAPVFLRRGERLLPGKAVRCRLYRYGEEAEARYSDTYCYAPEGNWLPYLGPVGDWQEREITIEAKGWYRLAIRTAGAAARLGDCVALTALPAEPEPTWVADEAARVAARVKTTGASPALRLFLLADTHHCVGGNWEDTLRSLRRTAELLPPDAVVHLGDLTDGMYPLAHTGFLARQVLEGLRSLAAPLYLCLGNHDRNYFRGNPETMSKRDSARWYLGRESADYYVDFPEHRLRLLFADSFDPKKKERYGFGLSTLAWFCRTLAGTPAHWRILVFSHVPPLARLHVWSRGIRNGPAMLAALHRIGQRKERTILGWIHGHNHADQVYRGADFPIVGIGCSKLESFPEHKPEGAVAWPRQRWQASQELWDVLQIPDEEDRLLFFRWGAGEDRFVESRKKS